jgi:succinate dehydrogenase hydrophobic anchor subunit
LNTIIFQGRSRENACLWLVKIVLGLFLVFVLGIHYVVNHFAAPGGLLTYNNVLQYYANPIIPIMEFLFLVFAVVHSLIGMRSILLDLNLSLRVQKIFDNIFIVVGAAAIVYGTWLLVVITGKTG